MKDANSTTTFKLYYKVYNGYRHLENIVYNTEKIPEYDQDLSHHFGLGYSKKKKPIADTMTRMVKSGVKSIDFKIGASRYKLEN